MEEVLINVADDKILLVNSTFNDEKLLAHLQDIKTGKWQESQLELMGGNKKKRSNVESVHSAESSEEVMKKKKIVHFNKTSKSSSEPTITKDELFAKHLSFEELNLNPTLVKNLNLHLNAAKPTVVQTCSIPELMKARDVFIKAQTGSGKTLAYVLPILQDLISNGSSSSKEGDEVCSERNEIDRTMGTHAIIIAPTRELSLQIYNVLRSLLRSFCNIVPGIITGGEKRKSEKARLRKGLTLLVSTPGRLLDHLRNTESFVYQHCRWLVFDEADRLLDLGFWNDLKLIIDLLNLKAKKIRQNVLVSATLNKDVNKLAIISLNNPMFISCSSNQIIVKPLDEFIEEDLPENERVYETPSTLRQHVLVVSDKRKCIALIAFLRAMFKNLKAKVIVFFSNCDSVEFYYALFSKIQIPSSLKKDAKLEPLFPASLFKLHGKLNQLDRSETFMKFSKSENGILLCTDVASRGLDIPKVTWIIQYDVSCDPAAYIHRIGRTARIGGHGNALLILLESEKSYLDVLSKKQMQFIVLSQEDVFRSLKVNMDKDKNKNNLQECALLQIRMETFVENGELKDLAINAYRSFIKSYATHVKESKSIFHIKNLHLGHICKNFCIKQKPTELNWKKLIQDQEPNKKTKKTATDYLNSKRRPRMPANPQYHCDLEETCLKEFI